MTQSNADELNQLFVKKHLSLSLESLKRWSFYIIPLWIPLQLNWLSTGGGVCEELCLTDVFW